MKLIKIERTFKAQAMFNKTQDSTWDREKEKTLKVTVLGIPVYYLRDTLVVEYETTDGKKIGFNK